MDSTTNSLDAEEMNDDLVVATSVSERVQNYSQNVSRKQTVSINNASTLHTHFRPLPKDTVEKVQASWQKVEENGEKAAEYLSRGIIADDHLAALFDSFGIDFKRQANVIVQMWGKVIHDLDNPEIGEYLFSLGEKHVAMNLEASDIVQLRSIMLHVIKRALGFGYTNQTAELWTTVSNWILSQMLRAMVQVDDETESEHVDILTEDIVAVVQASWKDVEANMDVAGSAFYNDLLRQSQEVRSVFSKTDFRAQSRRLLGAIGEIISSLSDIDTLMAILEDLGTRHVNYGVKPKYFKILKKSWFAMLEGALGFKFDEKTADCWHKMWDFMASVMKSSLRQAALLYTPPDPEKIKMNVLIYHIDRVFPQNLSFYADVWYCAYTTESSSQSNAFTDTEDVDPKLFTARPKWNASILNSMETEEQYRKENELICRKFEDGKWFTRARVKGMFSQSFDLHEFPFDQHTITLYFSLGADETIAKFDEDNIHVRMMPSKMDSMAGVDWNVYSPSWQMKSDGLSTGGSRSGKKYPQLMIKVPIARQWRHYIHDFVFPLLLIDILVWEIYFMDLEPVAYRLQVLITLLLTLFAFKWTVTESLPPVPYLTLMDYFFDYAYWLLFQHTLGQCVVGLMMQFYEDEDIAQIVDICMGGFTFIVFLFLHIPLFTKMKQLHSKYPKEHTVNLFEKISARARDKSNQSHGEASVMSTSQSFTQMHF